MTTEKITLKPDRGATIVFEGTLLAKTDFETRGGHLFYDVWETPGGAYIASSVFEHGDTGNQEWRACVVEPKMFLQEDLSKMSASAMEDAKAEAIRARRFEIMDFFDWNDRARSMLRKQAKWSFTWKVA